jgi:mono/diheme cytochrome c family protein
MTTLAGRRCAGEKTMTAIRFPIAVMLGLAHILFAAPDKLLAGDYFGEHVVPILQQRCLSCHNAAERKGDFSLQSATSFFEAGFVEAGNPAASHLVEVISPVGGSAQMPKNAEPLSSEEIAIIRKWIEEGAVWPDNFVIEEPRVTDFGWWSYQPIARPAVPQLEDPWVRTPIDAFILDVLTQKGLTHSDDTDRRTLIRRLTYDLTGLPPTPAQVDAFVNDADSNAYGNLVDRLLDSQHYGERWARHWLDVVKYADTCGYDKDKLRPNAWPYRDYVIRSLNEDKPYSQFVQEQIAGDVLFPGEPDGILGLGFIAAGPWDFIGHVEVSESKIDGRIARNLDRDDMVSNALNTFCSVTVQCARCHNHKFDPITQEHYYGLQSIFAAVDRAERPYNLDPDTARRRLEIEKRLKDLQIKLRALQKEVEDAGGGNAIETSGRRDLVTKAIEKTRLELQALPESRMIYAAATHFVPQANFKPTEGKVRAIHVLHRGNIRQPLDLATPGLLPLDGGSDWRIDANTVEGDRRATLARWLTDKHHPLLWRSIVNRVWQYHFGQGIVATPNDFGRMGAEPTHPKLLDWLAAEFRDSEQSLKQLHRLIVTSSVYRQSADDHPDNVATDSSNQLLWRMNRRRLTAEEIRDSILAVSGALDPTMGGPGFYLFKLEKTEHSPHYEYHKFDPNDDASHRRSIYRFIVRSQPDPWMTTLDCADSSQSTPRRNETLTSLQALSLLNNRFNLVMAETFADRLQRESPDLATQVQRALALVAQRPVSVSERDELVSYAESHGLPNLCRFMFNLSEFVFVD